MKYIPYLILLLSLNIKAIAQNRNERISVNFGLTHSILNEHRYKSLKYNLDPKIEVLMNFRISDDFKISTGFGFQTGEHVIIEEVAYLTTVNGELMPYKGTNHWNLDYLSISAPVYVIAPLNTPFIENYFAGVSLGWFWNYNLTERKRPNTSSIKINRSYLDFSFGVRKNLYQSDKISIALAPIFGYCVYLSDRNSWQNNYLFYQFKLSINFKTFKS